MNLTASSRLQLTQTHASQTVWQPAKLLLIQLMFRLRIRRFSHVSSRSESPDEMEILWMNSAFQCKADVHSPELRVKIRFKNKLRNQDENIWRLQTRQQRGQRWGQTVAGKQDLTGCLRIFVTLLMTFKGQQWGEKKNNQRMVRAFEKQ